MSKSSSTSSTKHGLHFGYAVTAMLLVAQMLVFIGGSSTGLVLTEIQSSLGVSVAEVGLIASIYAGMSNFGSLIWGSFTDKIGPRISLVSAALVFSIGVILFGLFGGSGYIIACVLWAIAGFGSSGLQETVIPKLINSWFVPEKRGHALRFVTPGGPLAGFLLGAIMPIGVANFGWGGAFVVLGIISLCLTFVFTFIRNSPFEMGLTPVGSAPDAVPAPPEEEVEEKVEKGLYAKVLRRKDVWHLGAIYIFFQFFLTCDRTYAISNFKIMGASLELAGVLSMTISIASIVAMQFWGPLSDKFGRKKILSIMLSGALIMAIAIFFVSSSGTASTTTLMILVTIAYIFEATAPVMMAMLADAFPQDISSACNGVVGAISAVGSYLAPWLGGLIIDAMGGSYFYYTIPVAVSCACCLIAVLTYNDKKKVY